jgi:Domain of unknown function (DUF4386)
MRLLNHNYLKELKMNPMKKEARIAGLLYLLMGVTGSFGLMYVPSSIIVPGDAVATAGKIINYDMLFRFGILSNLICQVSFIFLVLALERLFKGVDDKQSKLMVSLVIASVPVAFLNTIIQIVPLHLLSGAGYLKVFQSDQLNALMMVFINLYEQGNIVIGIFWGLWLFPFGYLVIKSGFIPKVFGILLIIGCFAYLTDSLTALLIPQQRGIIPQLLILPLSAGEISTIFWLLIKGVKSQK